MQTKSNNAKSAQRAANGTLSHETAKILTSLSIPLKGSKNEVLKELNAVMHVQVSYIIKAIETGIRDNPGANLEAAINLYLEAQCKHHYISNDIGN
jgi:hypothetical protein